MQKIRLSLIVLVAMCAQVFAGSLEPPAGPDSAASAMYSIEAIYQRLSTGTNVAKRGAGFRGPTGPPGSTMHTLNDVMAKAPSNVVDAATTNDVLAGKPFWGLTTNEWGTQTGTMPDIGAVTYTPGTTNQVVARGYHNGSGLVQGDPDLASTNIRVDVTIFGVTGTIYECSVPKTGQTNIYLTGDDGDLEKGVSWPVDRFTDNGDGTVTDNLTGLIWLKNANSDGSKDWTNAIAYCTNLCDPAAGLIDGSEAGDWRLPNRRELDSLLDLGKFDPALPDGHPFDNVKSGSYWTGTTCAYTTDGAWYVNITGASGYVYQGPKTRDYYYVWPVRGGL